ncbi:MAG TPA: Rne/Rng family ribonuclease [Desulfuromonadaceae bacterium]
MGATVSKKMLINVMHPEEARVAIVHDGRLMELNIEITGKEQIKGNIYKGVVLRVEPGLQAAFIDIGRQKPGFLQMGELHPDFWQWRDDIPEEQRKRRPRIQEVLRRGQELIVQVEKDERDMKGAALTSYISLPGRYMVIMPGSDSTGISRKVEQEGERKKLKAIVADMGIPEGIGYIIRTEAVGRTPEELKKDLDNLLALYEEIRQRAAEIKGAGEVYRDKGLIIRFIRDYFSDDIDEVLVDSKDAYREAKEFFRETMPTCEKLVKLHKEKRPIFSRFQLEEQIDQIYEKRVALPSGGSLIIEPTEALVSIDVNSGKSSGERGVEDTAFKTNLEAVEEVARQLRLRDLGGLIVIDLIDMRERKHNIEVEKALKGALKMDKARVNVGRISEFGMLEMSRQRIAKTLNDAIHLSCPHCEGRGKVKSVEAMALSFLRKVHAAAAKGTVAEVRGGLPLEVAYYLLNRKKRDLTQIENDYDIEVTVKGKTSFLLNQLELETVKREKPRMEDVLKSEAEAAEAPKPAEPKELPAEQPVEEGAPAEGGKKRKRRRKKKKHGGEPELGAGQVEQHEEAATPPSGEEQPLPEAVEEAEAGKKRKRRRRKKKHAAEAPLEAVPMEHPSEEAEAVEVAVPEAAPTPEEAAKPKKHRRRRSHKGEKGHEPEGTVPEAAAEVPSAPAPLPEAAPAEKPKRARAPRTRKKTEPEAAEAAPSEAVAAEAAALAEKPKRARASRTKKAAEAPTEAAEPPQEAPKRAPRTRRTKKAE